MEQAAIEPEVRPPRPPISPNPPRRRSPLAATLLATAALLPGRSALATCDTTASTGALLVVLEDAEAAFARLDQDAFHARTDDAARMVPCLEAVLPRATAARYHRLQGLRAWLVRDEERATQAFLAARHIERAYRFPVELVPEDHPTRQAYLALALDQLLVEPVETPRRAALFVDGRQATERPVNVPAIVQLVDGEGGLRWSTYLDAEAPLPPWPDDLRTGGEGRAALRAPLLYGTLGAAVASGALLGLAAGAAQRYDDPATPVEDLDGLRARTNGLLVGASVAGGLAAGGAVAVAWTFR